MPQQASAPDFSDLDEFEPAKGGAKFDDIAPFSPGQATGAPATAAKSPAVQDFENNVMAQAAKSVPRPAVPLTLQNRPVAPFDWQRAIIGGMTDIATNPEPGAETGIPSLGGPAAQSVQEMETPGKRGTGVLRAAATGAEALTPLMGPAALENPVSIATGLAEGTAASEGGGYLMKKGGMSDEDVANAKTLLFWAPGVARSVIDPKILAQIEPERTAVGATVAGGRAGAGVQVTPGDVTIGGKFGPFSGSKTFSRGGGPSELEPPTIEGTPGAGSAITPQQPPPAPPASDDPMAQAASAMNTKNADEARAARTVQGVPEPQPPAPTPPPGPPPIHEITPESAQKLASVIQQLPPELRAKAIIEMHGKMADLLLRQGKVVGPSGKIEVIDSPKTASRVAQQFINDEVERQDKVAEEKNKPSAAEPKPASKPEENPIAQAKALPRTADFSDVESFKETPNASPSERSPVEGSQPQAAPESKAAGSAAGASSDLSATTESGANARKTGREAFTKGDRVQLEDGRKATVIYTSPQDPFVRLQVDGAGKISKGITKLTKLGVESGNGETSTTAANGSEAADNGVRSRNGVLQPGTESGKGNASGGTAPNVSGAQGSGGGTPANAQRSTGSAVADTEGRDAEVPKYKFGNTQANIPEDSEAHRALESARARISPEDLAGDGVDVGGNHVTVRYGIKGEDTEGIKRYLSQQAPFEATLGKTEKFPPSEHSDGAAVIKAPIEAPELHRLNSELEQHGEFSEPTFKYAPHATVAYVKPEKADRYTGMNVTHGKTFTVNEVAISKRDGSQEIVKLGGKKAEAAPAPVASVQDAFDRLARSGVKTAQAHPAEHFTKQVETGKPALVERYLKENTTGDQVAISADRARSLFPEYAASKEAAAANTPSTNRASSLVASAAFDKALANGAVKGKEAVFVAGAPGAGKSSAQNAFAGEQAKVGLMYEGNLSDPELLQKRVKAVMDAGGHATVAYVYAPPKVTLERMIARAGKIGRYVPIDYGAQVAAKTPASIEKLHAKYGDAVRYVAIDNSGTPEAVKAQEGIDAIRRLADNRSSDEIRTEQLDHAATLRKSGKIDERLYQQIRAGSPHQGADGGNGSEHREETKSPLARPLELSERSKLGLPPERGKVGEMRVRDLRVAPHKFQYKLSTDAEGVGTLLKETKVFNPDLAGVISVWRDPADGKTYVVNGHHRYELAKRLGQKTVMVRHIIAPDAVAARAIGALQNIAEGRGSAIDAAKFFHDSGRNADDLAKDGISLGEKTAADGLAMSRLDPSIFAKVVSGDLRQGRAVAIGEATADLAEQKAILSLVEKKERSGAKVSDDTLSELIRLVRGAEQTTETTADLFGSQEITRSLALEKAEISAHIKQQLAKDKKLFGFVSKGDRATELQRGGNKIDVEKSKQISTGAAQAEEVYNLLSARGGPIASILDEAARQLADGDHAPSVKSEAYARVRSEIRKTLGQSVEGGNGGPEGTPEGGPDTGSNLFSPETELAPPFYSKAARVAFEKLPTSMSGESALATLKNAGVKTDEIKWIGLDDFLKDKPKVAKRDVLSYIMNNMVQVREVAKTGNGDRERLSQLRQSRGELIISLGERGYGLDQTMHGYDVETDDGVWHTAGDQFGYPDDLPSNVQLSIQRVLLYDNEISAVAHNGGADWTNAPGRGSTRYEQYSLPGEKKNYTELLLTLPTRPTKVMDTIAKEMGFGGWTNKLTEEQKDKVIAAFDRQPSAHEPFKTTHFEEPNILAHARFDERTDADGNKLLFVEEIQSDWHQKGKRVGYNVPVADYSAGYRQEKSVPNAPFKSGWHELAMKTMLRKAAEGGYDKIGWVTGQQTAERYDLSKSIQMIGYRKTTEPGIPETYMLTARTSDGRFIDLGAKKESELADTVGKDIAQKILDGEGDGSEGDKVLSGLDLKTGGEWAKNLYDRAIPNFLSKYGKKWGARVADTKLQLTPPKSLKDFSEQHLRAWPESTPEQVESAHRAHGKAMMETVHSLTVTPEMRKSVLSEGQPLFSPASETVQGATAKGIKFEKKATTKELPPYLLLNPDATEAINRVVGIRFRGVNVEPPMVHEIATKLKNGADRLENSGEGVGAMRLRALANALLDATDPSSGLHLIRESDNPAEQLATLHEEMLHGAQRAAGGGILDEGVPWRESMKDPGMAKMAANRIVPSLIRNNAAANAVVIVAEGIVDIMRGDASELSDDQAESTAQNYFEALEAQHGIEMVERVQKVENYIAAEAEKLGVNYGRQGVRAAGRRALARVLLGETGGRVQRTGEGQAAEPKGTAASGAETGAPPGNARKGPVRSRPPNEGGTLASTQPVGLTDEELAEWSKNKGFRVEPAGEQLDIFGATDPVMRVYRTGPRGREQKGLVYQKQLDKLKEQPEAGAAEPFALTGGETHDEQPRLFGAGDLGEIVGNPKAEGGIKLPTGERATSLFSSEKGELEPGKLAKAAGGAAGALGDYFRAERDLVAKSRDIQREFYNLEPKFGAAVLRAIPVMQQVEKSLGKDAKEVKEGVYHHLEDPENVVLNDKQDDLLDNVVLPIMDENNKLVEELKGEGFESSQIEGYVHRVVKGKGGWLDRIVSGAKRAGRLNPLSKSAPQLKGRTMMALEKKGDRLYPERMVVSLKGGQVTAWKDGSPTNLGTITNARDGRLWTDKDGNEWKLTQATTKEIETHTGLTYYHDPVASALVSNLQLTRAVMAARTIDAILKDPDFKTFGFKSEEGLNPPKDWQRSELGQVVPALRDYYWEPHVREVLDWQAARMKQEGGLRIIDNVDRLFRLIMLVNPIAHPLNVMGSWAFEKGVQGALPWRAAATAKTGIRALRDVLGKNENYAKALEAGGALQSWRESMGDISKLFFKSLSDDVEAKDADAIRLAKAVGFIDPATDRLSVPIFQQLHSFSSKAAWLSSDVFFLQSAYEKMDRFRGMTLEDALKETARFIPDYRLPTRMFDSHGLSSLLSNRKLTYFMAYHYGLLKSFSENMKSMAGLHQPPGGGKPPQEPPRGGGNGSAANEGRSGGGAGPSKGQEAAEAWGRAAMLYLIPMVLLPMLANRLLKKATGDERAKLRAPGPFGVIDNLAMMASHQKTPVEGVISVVTPNPFTEAGAELFFNRELRSGRSIYDPSAHPGDIASQLGNFLLDSVPNVGELHQDFGDEGRLKKFLLRQAQVSFPKTSAEKKAAEIAAANAPTKAWTSQQRDAYYAKSRALEALRDGDPSIMAEEEAAGNITAKQAKEMVKESRLTPLQQRVKGFSYGDALDVMDRANDEERAELEHILQNKRRNALKLGKGAEVEELEEEHAK